VKLTGAIPWVKQAFLLLALRAAGPSVVSEAMVSADHLERALHRARAPIYVEGAVLTVHPPRDSDALKPDQYEHVGSALCAAHLVMLPLCAPHGGRVTVRNVSSNRSSAEIWPLLKMLGADVHVEARGDRQGEPVADVTVSSGGLVRGGAVIAGEQAIRLADTVLPLLVLLGISSTPSALVDLATWRGDASLKILPRAVGFLRQAGFSAEMRADSVEIGGPAKGDGPLVATTGGEGRLALLGGVLGVSRTAPSRIDDVACLAHVFPRFAGTLRGLGVPARIVDSPF
jgi:5-enolpyruvylshikimate-3-phosphate synthase